MFKKLLIANRGEIACRIIATARSMGISCVAVYSDADRSSRHVRLADECVYIGASAASESYLAIDKLVRAALDSGAEAIHPGYGFLSENADLCRQCARAGLVFIGPSATAIESMGCKSTAKTLMEAAGVATVPGYHSDDQDPQVLANAAATIGYPVLLKAVCGGGGKGMRVVSSERDFDQALAAAMREAKASFDDSRVLLEKYLCKPRHIEIQIFCDSHGQAVHLFERDCSLQRRYQKVIEEAPAPGIDADLRARMGAAAIVAAQAIDYCGAATVEFLVDDRGAFFFMEMNTRLQVEHPVTEMITGQDLVEWQLLVAAGEPLPCAQNQLQLDGHAFEARIYAEDPERDFMPVSGCVERLYQPSEKGRHVRIDSGIDEGDEVGIYYDPMIAKLIVWDCDRERALRRLQKALGEYRIVGMTTNVGFLYNLASSCALRAGEVDTGFIEEHADEIFRRRRVDIEYAAPLAVGVLVQQCQRRAQLAAERSREPGSPWFSTDGWGLPERVLEVQIQSQHRSIGVSLAIDLGAACAITTDAGFDLVTPEGFFQCAEVPPDLGCDLGDVTGECFTAPMNGTVVTLMCAPGALVSAGDTLLVIEAMKMEHAILAPCGGTVSEFYCQTGDRVDGGATLLAFESNQ